MELSTGTAWEMSSSNPDNRTHIDLYLGTDSDDDASSAALALKSPSLVNGGGSAWSARVSGFKQLTSYDEWKTDDATGWSTKVLIEAGDVFAFRTPLIGGDRHYGKITIVQIFGAAGHRRAQVSVAWQPKANYIRFRSPR
jgi:hypothetical protein